MAAKWIVYIVRCSDATYYTGITNRLDERVQAHNTGVGAKYTRGRGPVLCVWSLHVESKSIAARYEYRIKKCTRIQKERIIIGLLDITTLLGE